MLRQDSERGAYRDRRNLNENTFLKKALFSWDNQVGVYTLFIEKSPQIKLYLLKVFNAL